MSEKVITGPADVAAGAAWLAKADPRFASFLDQNQELPLRLRPDGFAALLQAIVGQQISVASAAATWRRVVAAGLDQPKALTAAADDDLKAVGFSRPKIRYARALVAARIDYASLRDIPTEQVIRQLVAVPGIGPWTAEIYAMFSLGRADAFAAGDLALQEAARVLFGLKTRPTEKELRVMAAGWSPWRSVAARALWAYYRQIKRHDGVF